MTLTDTQSTSRLQWWTQVCWRYITATYTRYRKLNITGKCVLWFLILFHLALFSVLIIYRPARIFQFLYNSSQRFKAMRFGWLILGSILILASFPPLVGYSTCITVCGFAYGLEGFYVAAPATFIGSGLAFIILRFLFKHQVRAWTSKTEKWQALEQVIVAKGLPLIILIRMSPFPPYVYSQALFASISVVSFWQFMLATTFFQTRVLLEVFIGSRIAKLSDKNQRGEMDTATKIVNGTSIAAGILLGIGLGWFLYRKTQEQVKLVEDLPAEATGVTAQSFNEADEGAPLLRDVSYDALEDGEPDPIEPTLSCNQSSR